MAITMLQTITKAVARKALAQRIHAWLAGTTTSNGNAGGTTVVASALVGYGDSFFSSHWLLITSGSYAGQWRRVSDFTNSSGTLTVVNAYGGQILSGVTYELHVLRPDLITASFNEAIVKAYPAVRRAMQAWQVATARSYSYPFPRGMRELSRVRYDYGASVRKSDNWADDADSVLTAGDDYTAVAGTWGVSSEQLYSVTDADANLLTYATGLSVGDMWLRARVKGTLNHASVYRSPALVLRYTDSSNYLVVRLLNGAVALRKVDGGSESSLATGSLTTSDGVLYTLEVLAVGSRVQVWVDGVQLIDYELLGTDTRYGAFTTVGFRLDKAGSPATAARWDDWRVHGVGEVRPVPDWEQDAYRRTWTVGAQAWTPPLTTGHLFWLDGTAPLSGFTEDTTPGTLDSDSTAKLEIETGTPEWELLLHYAAGAAYGAMAQPNSGSAAADRAEYAAAATRWLQMAEAMRGRHGQPKPSRTLRHPAW